MSERNYYNDAFPDILPYSMIAFFPSREVALSIGSFAIHWYGLLYLLSFLLAWFVLPRLQQYRNLSLHTDEWSSVISAAVLGVLLGGRLGYVLLYDLPYFLSHPFEIFAVWKGGMASHGGFIGVAIALLWVLRQRSKVEILKIADTVTVPIALGLALGRLGNFINQELYGTVTALPWGISIPGVEGLRHPTAIYSIINNLLIALICFVYIKKQPFIAGRTMALFLMLYGLQRFIVEFFRDQAGVFMFGPMSEGQLLTIPVFLVGVWLWSKGE